VLNSNSLFEKKLVRPWVTLEFTAKIKRKKKGQPMPEKETETLSQGPSLVRTLTAKTAAGERTELMVS